MPFLLQQKINSSAYYFWSSVLTHFKKYKAKEIKTSISAANCGILNLYKKFLFKVVDYSEGYHLKINGKKTKKFEKLGVVLFENLLDKKKSLKIYKKALKNRNWSKTILKKKRCNKSPSIY